MKKLFMAAIAVLMISCSNNDVLDNYADSISVELGTKTELSLLSNGTRLASDEQKTETARAHFFIRIDNTIPGADSFSSTLYFPQDAQGGSELKSELNTGGLDESKATWKSLSTKIPKYIYDTTGKTTVEPLIDIPSIGNLIKAHSNKEYNLSQIDTTDTHIIWYVTKYEGEGRYAYWHVDGVLTHKNITNTDSIKGMDTKIDGMENDAKPDTSVVNGGSVEVNLGISDTIKYGQIQGHLSIHVRDTTDFTIYMPINPEYYCKQDDMMIVAKHDTSYSLKSDSTSVTYNIDGNPVTFTVTYTNTGITVKSSGVNSSILKYLRNTYQDGLTFEIRNYYNVASLDSLTAELSKSTITFVNNPAYYIQAVGKYKDVLDKYPIYVKAKDPIFTQDSIVENEGNNQSRLVIFKRN